MGIEAAAAGSLIGSAQEAVRRLVTEFKLNKNGGFFAILSVEVVPRFLLISEIGNCPPDKADRYFRLVQEKAMRLFYNSDHVSSFQSRDPDSDKWGGAIRVKNRIFSFSGLLELSDEAVSVFVAKQEAKLGLYDLSAIANISDNYCIRSILST